LISEIELFIAHLSEIQHIKSSDFLSLVHGDFYPRHIILNAFNEVTGVIDWGDVGLCHPAIDLAIAYTFLPVTSHAQFEQEYGLITQNTWELARFRALYSASLSSIYGASINDQNLVSAGLWGLENIRHSLNSQKNATHG
jgi:aminoglycoside phosphotransferase (APT) family kinase protein